MSTKTNISVEFKKERLIKSETRWAIINTRTNEVWLRYIGFSKNEVIKDFMNDEDELEFTGHSWSEFSKKYHWDCIKVKISFEQINKK